MKPTTISPKRKQIEIFVLFLCFCTAMLLNILSIILFHTAWKELFTQIPVVIILTLGFYFVLLFFRGISWIVLKYFSKKRYAK
jgi:hypothetical protein